MNKKIRNENRERLIKWLIRLDEYMEGSSIPLTVTVVGGSSLILKNILDRYTKDIDSISPIDREITMFLRTEDIDINSRCATYKYTFYGWENEVVNLDLGVTFKNITVNTLSTEMIMASKFFTRLFDRDLSEIGYTYTYIDQKKLEKLVIGIWFHVISLDKMKLIDREMEIVELYRARRWDYENSDIKKLINGEFGMIPRE